ncbi:GGDEF domain-containing protein [Draconibacterium sp.]|nr:GGDEF domain-containing protein [Luminiphilus sp.]MDA8827655.1 GGDEF domain-containing protein [Luminiphilus sp.]MDB4582750.1 GGDEF domain-containing protein [Draconibacterium sp.]
MSERDHGNFGGGRNSGYSVEEITPGLPVQAPIPVALEERIEVSRYLARALTALHSDMLDSNRPSVLLEVFFSGISRILGCEQVEFWLHDPVGMLGGSLGDAPDLNGQLILTPDSTKITSIYSDQVAPRAIADHDIIDFGILANTTDRQDVFVIPAVEQEHIVGSLHFKSPRLDLTSHAGDLELLFDFMSLVPVALRLSTGAQLTSELMLVDPLTRVANREGFTRDLDREIGRARRAGRHVALVSIRLCGLEGMANLSQQHIQGRLLSEVAHKIAGGLRATDAVGRVDAMCFGVVVTEAQPSSIEAIGARYQEELSRDLLDDGTGGSIEVRPNVSWASVNPKEYPGRAISELSGMMLESVLQASTCNISGEVEITKAAQL